MFKLDRKIISIGMTFMLGTTLSIAATNKATTPGVYTSKKGAIDGGVIYPRQNNTYTAYRIITQDTKGVHFGRTPTADEIKAWDTDIMPDGTGLPVGEGSVEEGDELYEAQCASCHGEFGAGGSGYPTLSGGDMASLKNQRVKPGMDAPKRTIGTYWPKASTLLWYIRDAMPYAHPKSLTNNEIYAITAYLLSVNEIKIDGKEIDDEFILSNKNFVKITMPNEKGFYPNIDGKDGIENVRKFFSERKKNIGAGTRCMKNCKDPGMEGKEAEVMKIGNEITAVVPPYSTVRDLPVEKEGGSISKAEKLYDTSCKLCHASDNMGAPKVGDADAWTAVMKKGMDKVLVNAIKGTGGMPPKGGNMDLSDADIKEIVDYMVDASK